MTDHQRPLNARGTRAAARVRGFLEGKRLQPGLVLSSSAVRTRQTVQLVFEGAEPGPEIRYDDALYLASAVKILEVIAALEDDPGEVMLVGHNPGVEELFARLTGLQEHFPTATLANITLPIEKWSETTTTKGELEWLVTPKQLEGL